MNSTINYDFLHHPKMILRKVLFLKLSDFIKTNNKINYNFSSPIITVSDEHDPFSTF